MFTCIYIYIYIYIYIVPEHEASGTLPWGARAIPDMVKHAALASGSTSALRTKLDAVLPRGYFSRYKVSLAARLILADVGPWAGTNAYSYAHNPRSPAKASRGLRRRLGGTTRITLLVSCGLACLMPCSPCQGSP